MNPRLHFSQRLSKVALAISAGLVLASCGGGDPYAGLWSGDVAGRQASTIVLDGGKYYMLYWNTPRPGSAPSVAGLVEGTGEFQGARFTSIDARDYNWEVPFTPARGTSLAGKVGGHMTVSGTVQSRGAFSVAYKRDFDNAIPQLEALAGTYTGEAVFILGVRPATFVVTREGAVSTVVNACSITGRVSPRADTNAYDLTLTFGGFPCFAPGAQFNGVAYFREDVRRLEAAVTHASRTQAIAFVAAKN